MRAKGESYFSQGTRVAFMDGGVQLTGVTIQNEFLEQGLEGQVLVALDKVLEANFTSRAVFLVDASTLKRVE